MKWQLSPLRGFTYQRFGFFYNHTTLSGFIEFIIKKLNPEGMKGL